MLHKKLDNLYGLEANVWQITKRVSGRFPFPKLADQQILELGGDHLEFLVAAHEPGVKAQAPKHRRHHLDNRPDWRVDHELAALDCTRDRPGQELTRAEQRVVVVAAQVGMAL